MLKGEFVAKNIEQDLALLVKHDAEVEITATIRKHHLASRLCFILFDFTQNRRSGNLFSIFTGVFCC